MKRHMWRLSDFVGISLLPLAMSRVTKRPVFASAEVLEKYSFAKTSEPLGEDLTQLSFLDALCQPSGWKFTSYHDKILNEKGLSGLTENIKSKLAQRFPSLHDENPNTEEWIEEDSLNVNACKLHVPPMLFGNDVFHIQFGDFILSMDANDAILCWAAQHTKEEVTERPLDVIKVPYAAKWTARMHDNFNISGGAAKSTDGHAAPGISTTTSNDAHTNLDLNTSVVTSVRECVWTFSSDYLCTILRTEKNHEKDTGDHNTGLSSIHDCIVGGAVLRARSLPSSEGHAMPLQGAFCTTHSSSTSSTAPASARVAPEKNTTSTDVPAGWCVEAVDSSGIDFEMLKNQDEPILFYDEFLLYQDDLEDCGEITLDAKLRVMPKCWFLLVKQFLRVDGARIRCRETRFFHKFNDRASGVDGEEVTIAMDVCWRELAATPPVATIPLTPQQQQQQHVSASSIGTGSGGNAGAGAGIMAGIATPPSAHSGLLGTRAPFAPPPQALLSASNHNNNIGSAARATGNGLMPAVEAQLFGAQGKNLTHLLPVVNEKEGIHQHYLIRLQDTK